MNPEEDLPVDDADSGEGLDELKQLLADEGLGDDLSTDEELEIDLSAPVEETAPTRGRTRRGQNQDRRAQDEQTFRDLESQLAAEPLEIKISEDRLEAAIGRIGPENSNEEILEALRRRRLTAVDEKAIAAALTRAAQGQPQYDIVVCRGRAPVVRQPAHLRWHLPDELQDQEPLPLDSLQHALCGPSAEAVDTWSGIVHAVHAGEVLVDIGPADYDEGCDVQGEPVTPALEEPPPLPQGEHTRLSEDGNSVVATLYGYAGVVAGEPTVLPPVWMAPDSMQAEFVCIDAKAMTAPSAAEVDQMLQSSWIERGVLPDALEAVTRLEGDRFPRRLPIARGQAPKQGKDGQLKYRVAPSKLPKWTDLQSLRRSASRQDLDERLQELLGSGRVFATVTAADVLVERLPATPGVDGFDVRGEELPADDVEEPEFDLGEGVDVDDDGLQALAKRHGVLCVHGSGQISVVSPLWLAADRMELGYLNFQPGASRRWPSLQELEALVEADPQQSGVDLSAWPEALARLEQEETAESFIPIAVGTKPAPGRDAVFDWAIRMGGQAGRIMEDGSIDLRDRQLITVVAPGDVIGRWMPPQEGTAGNDVCNRVLAAPIPVDIEVVTDTKITSELQDDGSVLFKATAAGGISSVEENRRKRGALKKRLRLSLAAVSEIERDVDYSTGHIDFQGDVIIKGSVKPLFKVKASGSVTIEGNVEPGAQIEAGGEVCVGGGIIGQATRVEAGGLVMAKFIQQATILTQGDIQVGAYVFEASLRATGTLQVEGKGEGSGRALVGGMAWAAGGIEVPSLGSPSNPNLRLVVGIDPELVTQADRWRALLRTCDEKEQAALAAFGLKTLETDRIRQKLEHAEDDEKQKLLEAARRVAEHAQLHEELTHRLEEIAQQQGELALHSSIAIAGEVFAGPELRIGERLHHIDTDTQAVRFHLQEVEGRTQIEADSL